MFSNGGLPNLHGFRREDVLQQLFVIRSRLGQIRQNDLVFSASFLPGDDFPRERVIGAG